MNNRNIGRYIINSNRFMSLATSHINDTWIAPVFYVVDEEYNLYFVSFVRSTHAIHIILNSQVAVSIFNSEQDEGDANGLQIKGVAYRIPESRYKNIIPLFCEKVGVEATPEVIESKTKEYNDKERVIFQVKPTEVYIQDKEYWKEHHVDKRVKIDLYEKLRFS